jgi:4-hydroxybenzoate polyprenyltransferase/phosphoserine phosphatase
MVQLTEADGKSLPLCIDLDGTLLRTDSLHEGVLRAFKADPAGLLSALPLAFRSKAGFKRRIAEIAPIRTDCLPLNEDLVAYLETQRACGRRVDLVSAADQSIVEAVAAQVPLFDDAHGSDGETNLSAGRKLDRIRHLHGDGFVYAGDSRADLPIWAAAAGAIVVGREAFIRAAGRLSRIETAFPRKPPLAQIWRALRPHQWAKNLLIFVPLVLAGPEASRGEFFLTLLAFAAFSMIASAGYIFNDLMDLDSDRLHPRKRLRPFAAGTVTAAEGVLVFALLIAASTVIAVGLGAAFAATCLVYFAGTMAYSLWLKRVALIDVLVLASLYTIRIFAGSALIADAFSFWIFTFSMFIFASLAILKRYSELSDGDLSDAVLQSRGYRAVDLPLFLPFGAGCSVAAALLFVIYLVEERFPSGVYARPEMLWLIFPVLLLWQMHMWRSALHGIIREDPVLFAIKDRLSQVLAILTGVIIALSW